MKISIITFHCAISHGAALQSVALCRFLEAAGHETNLIDYRPDSVVLRPDWRRTRFHGWHPAHLESWAIRRRFAAFWRRTYRLTPRTYRTNEELKADPPEADAYICGSDQIWNPIISGGRLDPAYFLDFAPAGCRRIAYAASFGGSELPPQSREPLLGLLNGLDAVSCREPSGAGIAASLLNRTVPVVLDPTFLWREYDRLVPGHPRAPARPFVLAYPMQATPEFTRAAVAAGRALDAPLRFLNGPWRFWTQPGRPAWPDPGRWTVLIRQARGVLTQSFHGTVFSILFRKPFAVLPLVGPTSNRNARLVELLQRLGLEDRLVPAHDLEAIRSRLTTPIDWNRVGSRLAQYREESIRYLTEALR